MKRTMYILAAGLSALLLLLGAASGEDRTIPRNVLAEALADGGFIIVMRHASSPRQRPDAATANPDNVDGERQLDETGRRDAMAMGEALRDLGIGIGEVLSSPAYRAVETARMMGFMEIEPVDRLSNQGMRDSREEYAEWLREEVGRRMDGGNRLLITHGPNMSAAFPDYSAGMQEGEALIFDPRGMEGPVMTHRIKITEWADL